MNTHQHTHPHKSTHAQKRIYTTNTRIQIPTHTHTRDPQILIKPGYASAHIHTSYTCTQTHRYAETPPPQNNTSAGADRPHTSRAIAHRHITTESPPNRPPVKGTNPILVRRRSVQSSCILQMLPIPTKSFKYEKLLIALKAPEWV